MKNLLNNTVTRTALACALVLLAGLFYGTVRGANEITQKFVRFHIIGNSDGAADQEVKMKVRTKIFETADLSGINSKEATLSYFIRNKDKIEDAANAALKESGFSYAAKVNVEKKPFPIREYADFTLPGGIYDAVSVELGEAKGKNFFCVMYPGLCKLDSVTETTPENIEKLNSVLTEKEAAAVTGNKAAVKFKLAEVFNKIIGK
jgi:stage II sporulation protein R